MAAVPCASATLNHVFSLLLPCTVSATLMDELSLLNQQETNQRKGEKLLNHKQIVNSFLLLFDSKLNSVVSLQGEMSSGEEDPWTG